MIYEATCVVRIKGFERGHIYRIDWSEPKQRALITAGYLKIVGTVDDDMETSADRVGGGSVRGMGVVGRTEAEEVDDVSDHPEPGSGTDIGDTGGDTSGAQNGAAGRKRRTSSRAGGGSPVGVGETETGTAAESVDHQ